MRWPGLLMLGMILFSGCARVNQYPEVKVIKPPSKPEPIAVPAMSAWLETSTRPDVPIVFVPTTDPEWKQLPKFWNTRSPGLGSRTLHLAQLPLTAIMVIEAAAPHEVVKIKVPLGLPDPTPQVPGSNPLTLTKWQLGKDLFEERMLKVGGDMLSCSSCHQPGNAFADFMRVRGGIQVNSLSLVNSVYNRRQFWDGRVEHLEEVLVGNPGRFQGTEEEIGRHHAWPNLGESLLRNDGYRNRFYQVFNVLEPTQDTVAKALATYLRTLLRGHSLYDEAEQVRQNRKDPTLAADHLEAVLTEQSLTDLGRAGKKKAEVAKEWALGLRLFQGKGQCAACHSGPLFTDQDFHNLGIWGSTKGEGGRFIHLPVGRKDPRYVGAYRTPTLRNLVQRKLYFHDEAFIDLRQVVKFYSDGLFFNQHLDKLFLDRDGLPRVLQFSEEESSALVLWLYSLEGRPLEAPVVADQPSGKK